MVKQRNHLVIEMSYNSALDIKGPKYSSNTWASFPSIALLPLHSSLCCLSLLYLFLVSSSLETDAGHRDGCFIALTLTPSGPIKHSHAWQGSAQPLTQTHAACHTHTLEGREKRQKVETVETTESSVLCCIAFDDSSYKLLIICTLPAQHALFMFTGTLVNFKLVNWIVI